MMATRQPAEAIPLLKNRPEERTGALPVTLAACLRLPGDRTGGKKAIDYLQSWKKDEPAWRWGRRQEPLCQLGPLRSRPEHGHDPRLQRRPAHRAAGAGRPAGGRPRQRRPADRTGQCVSDAWLATPGAGTASDGLHAGPARCIATHRHVRILYPIAARRPGPPPCTTACSPAIPTSLPCCTWTATGAPTVAGNYRPPPKAATVQAAAGTRHWAITTSTTAWKRTRRSWTTAGVCSPPPIGALSPSRIATSLPCGSVAACAIASVTLMPKPPWRIPATTSDRPACAPV